MIYIFLGILVLIGLIDLKKFKIPNLLVILLFGIGIVMLSLNEYNVLLRLAYGIAVVVLLDLFNRLFMRLKGRRGMGYGDIKLLGVLTVFYGLPQLLAGLWLASLISIPGFYLFKRINLIERNADVIPFGFFLSISFLLLHYYSDPFSELYLSLFNRINI